MLINNHLSEGKINVLDQRIDHMGRLVESIIGNNRASSQANESVSPSPSQARQATGRLQSCDESSSNHPTGSSQNLLQSGHLVQATIPSRPHTPEHEDTGARIEGPSSLSAQSCVAVRFLHEVAGSDPDIGQLLRTLGQVIEAIQKQSSDKALCNFDVATIPADRDFKMPPIEVSVALIRKSKGVY